MGRTSEKTLVRHVQSTKRDTDERVAALRLQAMAWRQLVMIALVDQESARRQAQWLLFQTVPFTNGPVIEKWINENEALARECAIKSGVCAALAERGA